MTRKLKYAMAFISILVLSALLLPANLGADSTSQVQSFVTRFYVTCLDRTPDSDGLNSWTNWLINKQKTGADVVRGIVLSDEFKSHNYDNGTFVTIMYKAFFDREADDSGYKIWTDKLNSGVSRETVLNGFLQSQEFVSLCGNYGIVPFAGASTSNSSSSGQNSSLGTGAGFSGTKINFIIWGDDSAFDRPGGRVNGGQILIFLCT